MSDLQIWILFLSACVFIALLTWVLWKTIGIGSLDKETRKRISEQKGFWRE